MNGFFHKKIDNLLFIISFFIIVTLSLWIFMLNYGKSDKRLQMQRLIDEKKIMLEKIKIYNKMRYGVEGQEIDFQSLQMDNEIKGLLENKSRHIIAILFTHLDCGSCVNKELRFWQGVYNKIIDKKKLIIVAITRSPNIQNSKLLYRGIFRYPLLFDSDDQNKSLFSRLDIPGGYPVVLFIENQRIVYAHVGTDENGEQSKLFLQKIHNFLDKSLISMPVD